MLQHWIQCPDTSAVELPLASRLQCSARSGFVSSDPPVGRMACTAHICRSYLQQGSQLLHKLSMVCFFGGAKACDHIAETAEVQFDSVGLALHVCSPKNGQESFSQACKRLVSIMVSSNEAHGLCTMVQGHTPCTPSVQCLGLCQHGLCSHARAPQNCGVARWLPDSTGAGV